jgi:hypothetical protein
MLNDKKLPKKQIEEIKNTGYRVTHGYTLTKLKRKKIVKSKNKKVTPVTYKPKFVGLKKRRKAVESAKKRSLYWKNKEWLKSKELMVKPEENIEKSIIKLKENRSFTIYFSEMYNDKLINESEIFFENNLNFTDSKKINAKNEIKAHLKYLKSNLENKIGKEKFKEIDDKNVVIKIQQVFDKSDSPIIYYSLGYSTNLLNKKPKIETEYELLYLSLGNGTTIVNKLQEEKGDYKKVAHVSERGEITIYDKFAPSYILEEINKYSNKIYEDSKKNKTQNNDDLIDKPEQKVKKLPNKSEINIEKSYDYNYDLRYFTNLSIDDNRVIKGIRDVLYRYLDNPDSTDIAYADVENIENIPLYLGQILNVGKFSKTYKSEKNLDFKTLFNVYKKNNIFKDFVKLHPTKNAYEMLASFEKYKGYIGTNTYSLGYVPFQLVKNNNRQEGFLNKDNNIVDSVFGKNLELNSVLFPFTKERYTNIKYNFWRISFVSNEILELLERIKYLIKKYNSPDTITFMFYDDSNKQEYVFTYNLEYIYNAIKFIYTIENSPVIYLYFTNQFDNHSKVTIVTEYNYVQYIDPLQAIVMGVRKDSLNGHLAGVWKLDHPQDSSVKFLQSTEISKIYDNMFDQYKYYFDKITHTK